MPQSSTSSGKRRPPPRHWTTEPYAFGKEVNLQWLAPTASGKTANIVEAIRLTRVAEPARRLPAAVVDNLVATAAAQAQHRHCWAVRHAAPELGQTA